MKKQRRGWELNAVIYQAQKKFQEVNFKCNLNLSSFQGFSISFAIIIYAEVTNSKPSLYTTAHIHFLGYMQTVE